MSNWKFIGVSLDDPSHQHNASASDRKDTGLSGGLDAGRRLDDGLPAGNNPEGQATHPVGVLTRPPATDTCEVYGADPAQYVVKFTYKNWRGEIAERRVVPIGVAYGANKWHPEPQWLMLGLDLAHNEPRHFAMKDISNWKPA